MKTQRTKDMERLMDALYLCRTLHAEQIDKCGQPYWIHPFTVAMRAFTGYGSCDSISYSIVGLLHDITEDTGVPVEALAYFVKLTPQEIEALELLTRKDGVDYNEYIDSIINSGNEIAMVVKLDDLLHNMNLNRLIEADIQITDKDIRRTENYRKAFDKLHAKLNEG